MANIIMHPPSDPLDPLLDRWRETPEPPPYMAAEVWRRIAAVESRVERPGLFARMEAAFARPSFVVAFVAACMLLGLSSPRCVSRACMPSGACRLPRATFA